MRENGLTFATLLDERSDTARIYQVRGIPTTFFIDREGVIRIRHSGPLDEARIREYAELLLR